MESVNSRENIVGKGENAINQHFVLFKQCFPRVAYSKLLNSDSFGTWASTEIFNLTLSQTSPCFYVSAVEVF